MPKQGPEFIGRNWEPPKVNINYRMVVLVVSAVALALWLVRGGPVYTVAPDEEGIVLRMGKYHRTTEPGLHFKMPWPIEKVERPKVRQVKRLEFGFRSPQSADSSLSSALLGSKTYRQDREMLREAQMLTGDENVVDCTMVVQFRISDAKAYLFNFSPGDVEDTLRDVGEAALRQAVGDHPLDDALTVGKSDLQIEIQDKMQELADLYGMGVVVTQVQLQDVQPPVEVADAFNDVASAREEREESINLAKAYQREQMPLAEGESERMRQEAEGYKQARIADATGAVARFSAIAQQYEAAPELTRARLYLDTMAEVLPTVRITVVDENLGMVNLRSFGGDPPPIPILEPKGLKKGDTP
ncbi:MAG: FtsH protease activity modulator HflK [Candidatus Hydrogenedentes bacterium]|nr:FtsH protease activity modulator HflK [Candidatus Hydrogenedentota bacterium]